MKRYRLQSISYSWHQRSTKQKIEAFFQDLCINKSIISQFLYHLPLTKNLNGNTFLNFESEISCKEMVVPLPLVQNTGSTHRSVVGTGEQGGEGSTKPLNFPPIIDRVQGEGDLWQSMVYLMQKLSVCLKNVIDRGDCQ